MADRKDRIRAAVRRPVPPFTVRHRSSEPLKAEDQVLLEDPDIVRQPFNAPAQAFGHDLGDSKRDGRLSDIAHELLPGVARGLGGLGRRVPDEAIEALQTILRRRRKLLLAKHALRAFAGDREALSMIRRTGRILARGVEQDRPRALQLVHVREVVGRCLAKS